MAIINAKIFGFNAIILIAILKKNSNWQFAKPNKLALFIEWLYIIFNSYYFIRFYILLKKTQITNNNENRQL